MLTQHFHSQKFVTCNDFLKPFYQSTEKIMELYNTEAFILNWY